MMNSRSYRLNNNIYTASDSDTLNQYFATLRRPDVFRSPIPDGNMSPAVIKTTQISTTFTQAVTDAQMLLLIPFHSPEQKLRLYSRTNHSLYPWALLALIDQTQDLSLDFVEVRLVSAMVGIRSSTISGSAFNIAGQMVAVACNYTPNFSTLNYDGLLAYKKDNINAQPSISVSNGIVALAPLEPEPSFYHLETENNWSEDVVTKYVWDHQFTLNPGGQPSNTFVGIDFSTIGQVWGHNELKVNVKFDAEANSANRYLRGFLRIFTVRAKENSGVYEAEFIQEKEIPVSYFISVITNDAAPLTKNEFDLSVPFYSVREFAYATLTLGLYTSSGVFQAANVPLDIHVELHAFTINRRGVMNPSTLIAWKSVPAEQQLEIVGCFNYEAKPNASLARNLPSKYLTGDPMDLYATEALFASAEQLGLREIMSWDDYAKTAPVDPVLSYGKEKTYMQASSVSNFFRNIWTTVKPVLRSIAPSVGTAIGTGVGSYYGQPMIGTQLGSIGGNTAARFLSASKPQWTASSVEAPEVIDNFNLDSISCEKPSTESERQMLWKKIYDEDLGMNIKDHSGTHPEFHNRKRSKWKAADTDYNLDSILQEVTTIEREVVPAITNATVQIPGVTTYSDPYIPFKQQAWSKPFLVPSDDNRRYTIFSKGMFVITDGDQALVVNVYVTAAPVRRKGNVENKFQEVPAFWRDLGDGIHISANYVEPSEVTIDAIKYRALHSLWYRMFGVAYITYDFSKDFEGDSCLAATYQALELIPSRHPITGGEKAVTMIMPKLKAAASIGTSLYIYSGETSEIQKINAISQKVKLQDADGFYDWTDGRNIIGFYGSIGALNLMQYYGTLNASATTASAVQKSIAESSTNQNALQKVVIGGVEQTVDTNQLWDKWKDEDGFMELLTQIAGPGAEEKITNALSKKGYVRASRLIAQVASKLLAERKKRNKPATSGRKVGSARMQMLNKVLDEQLGDLE